MSATGTTRPRVWFHRRLVTADAGTNGGNLKLRDCFDHFRASDKWEPVVFFSPGTVWPTGAANLWSDLRSQAQPRLDPQPGDLLFFSGADWLALPEASRHRPPVPVINIVQPRHVRPSDPRRPFLAHPALRIAKSANGERILRDHGVNGPLTLIPDTIDLSALPPVPEKDIDVLVLGLKQPDFAREVTRRISAASGGKDLRVEIQLPPKLPTRRAFLELLARARVAACVPLDLARGGEGFYLPALEAMALDALVVCPHAIGNVDHCRDGENCLVPAFTPAGVADGVLRMLSLPSGEQDRLRRAGRVTADAHDLTAERAAVLDLADRAHELWSDTTLFVPSATPRRGGGWWNILSGRWNKL